MVARIIWQLLVLSLCGPLLTGCSFLFVTSAPDKVIPGVQPTCTTSAVAPFVDLGVAAFQGVRTGLAMAADGRDYNGVPISREVDIALGVGLGALFIASAAYGFSKTSECEDAKLAAENMESPAAATPYEQPRPAAPPPKPQGPSCDYDAQCGDSAICEQGRCQESGS
ncbi:MAG: hypothetical protein OEZ06_20185 [Myxococcales bacterium]|nr:hypothetical protein [Myxococcales bacterium]